MALASKRFRFARRFVFAAAFASAAVAAFALMSAAALVFAMALIFASAVALSSAPATALASAVDFALAPGASPTLATLREQRVVSWLYAPALVPAAVLASATALIFTSAEMLAFVQRRLTPIFSLAGLVRGRLP